MIVSKQIVFILCLLFVFSCTTPPKPKGASEYLLSTDKSTTNSLTEIKNVLRKHKYKVQFENVSAGILTMHPRSYTFSKNGKKISGQHVIQLRQEGGSVKLRVVYKCQYNGEKYEACYSDDTASNAKIKRLDASIVQILNTLLVKNDNSKNVVEVNTQVEATEPKENKPRSTKEMDAAAESSEQDAKTKENWDEFFSEEN